LPLKYTLKDSAECVCGYKA